MDSTCSFTAGLVSNALTIAPIALAWPTAAKPATPPPITRIFAGGTFPAAVICPTIKVLIIVHPYLNLILVSP